MDDPDPPDDYKLQREQPNLFRDQMVIMSMRQIMSHYSNAGHKNKVEEQFEPGSMTIFLENIANIQNSGFTLIKLKTAYSSSTNRFPQKPSYILPSVNCLNVLNYFQL